MKRLAAFDLDGTLALSKQPLDDEMADLLWGIFDPTQQLPRDPATIDVDLTGQVSRKVRAHELDQWDWIIAMDGSNRDNLLRMGADPQRVKMMLSFAGPDAPEDVPDPYYEGGFGRVYDLVYDGCAGLLEWLESKG